MRNSFLSSARQLDQPSLVKPRETRDESMQGADTQIPLRCSSPANSEAQPDLCRKGCPKEKKPETQSVASVVSDSSSRVRFILLYDGFMSSLFH